VALSDWSEPEMTVTQVEQHFGNARHADTTNADKVDVRWRVSSGQLLTGGHDLPGGASFCIFLALYGALSINSCRFII
jgi:hypothetical protein